MTTIELLEKIEKVEEEMSIEVLANGIIVNNNPVNWIDPFGLLSGDQAEAVGNIFDVINSIGGDKTGVERGSIIIKAGAQAGNSPHGTVGWYNPITGEGGVYEGDQPGVHAPETEIYKFPGSGDDENSSGSRSG